MYKITGQTLNNILKWVATAITLIGAVLTSLNIYPLNVIAFNLGSVLWLIFAIRIKEPSLIVVNTGLLLVYVAGLVKAL
jgi:hypothetical protein